MSVGAAGERELRAALVALDRIAEFVAGGRPAFDQSKDRQIAVVFCWVNIGSHLKQYERRARLDPVGDVFAAPIKMRDKLVYGNVMDTQYDTIWSTCVRDGPALRALVAAFLGALGV